MDDALNFQAMFSPNEWHTVDVNEDSMVESKVKTPEEFHKEVQELQAKYNLKNPNMWDNESPKH